MARYNLRDVKQAISIENTAVNEVLSGDVGAEFRLFPSDAIGPVIPTRTPVEDNAVGDGKAYPKQSKPYYFNPINYPYSMALNSTMGQRILRMWLGGTATVGALLGLTGTKDTTVEMKDPGAAPMVCNLLRSLGGEGFLFADAFVQTIEISQQGAGEPRISAQFQNAGYYKKIADTSIDITDVTAMVAYLKYHGTKSTLIFSDGVDSYNFASEGRLCDVSFTGNQNVIVDQLPGDGFVDAVECYGAYGKNFFIDIQSAEMKVKVYMDNTFAQFTSWLANRKLTSVTWLFKTCEPIGLTTNVSEIEIKIPVAEFNIEGDTQGNFSAYSFSIKAIEGDPTTNSLVIGRFRRVSADLLDEVVP